MVLRCSFPWYNNPSFRYAFPTIPPGKEVKIPMLTWALIFLVVAIVAAVVGLTGVAGIAANIAWVLFVLFIIIAIVFFVLGRRPPV
jgi:uncharacterized membrane protein YtjA (UPF0391 family)